MIKSEIVEIIVKCEKVEIIVKYTSAMLCSDTGCNLMHLVCKSMIINNAFR